MNNKPAVDGFINFFKETGLPSNKALAKIKNIIRCKKAGFLGTLDPVATGILPIALGRATKLLRFFENSKKKYRATMRFGSEFDTQDSTGEVTKTGPVPAVGEREKLEKTIAGFAGEIKQIPPMYSAKKVNGQRLYEIARKGGHVEREPKQVTVHSIVLEEFTGETAVLTAVVSKGTYIRALCEDIGRSFGCPAHMAQLTREAVHNFTVKDSFTLDRLYENRDDQGRWLLPLDYPLMFLPKIDLTEKEQRELYNGLPIDWQKEQTGYIRLYDTDGTFFGMGLADPLIHKLAPEKIFSTDRAKQLSA